MIINATVKEIRSWPLKEGRHVSPLGDSVTLGNGVRALKIRRSSATDAHYYLTYRNGTGYQSTKPIAVLVNRASESITNSSNLLKWGMPNGGEQLRNGETFTDSANGITFRVKSMTAAQVVITVGMGGALVGYQGQRPASRWSIPAGYQGRRPG
jgi:hypothetical protein